MAIMVAINSNMFKVKNAADIHFGLDTKNLPPLPSACVLSSEYGEHVNLNLLQSWAARSTGSSSSSLSWNEFVVEKLTN